MRALVYTKPNEVQIQDYADPEIVEDEVILRIEAVGICGSDMHAYHGHDPRRKPGLVLGHEFAGVVVQSRSQSFEAGARVTGNPLITCGRCAYCLQGRNNLCSDRTMVGMTRPGAFAEQMSIPASSLIALPDQMNMEIAALTEPAATAVHAVDLSRRALQMELPEASVLVIGGGAIGLLSALYMRSLGVHELAVTEVNDRRRAAVSQAVGCQVIDSKVEPVQSNRYELVLDCVGSALTRKVAIDSVKPGGVVMHVGLQDWASEIDMRKLTLSEITLLGTYTYTTEDLRRTVTLLDEGVFGDCKWVETRSLTDGPGAFSDLHHGRTAAAKIILRPHA
jgi:2-desacetyl-2-hydroxyethyl bacteriochlorophyllide A dehydrogenase